MGPAGTAGLVGRWGGLSIRRTRQEGGPDCTGTVYTQRAPSPGIACVASHFSSSSPPRNDLYTAATASVLASVNCQSYAATPTQCLNGGVSGGGTIVQGVFQLTEVGPDTAAGPLTLVAQ